MCGGDKGWVWCFFLHTKVKGGGTNKPWNMAEECRNLRQRQCGDWMVGRDKELGVGEDTSIPVHLPGSGGRE